MVTIERVICPVDTSVHSANALRVAAAWARWYGAWLHVLHVAPLPQPMLSPTGILAALPARPLPDITAEVEQFVADTLGADHHAIVDVTQGQVVGTIVHASARPHALMVMGTHGWSGLDRLLLGSVAERVSHSTHCPLLVVPQASPMTSGATLKQILCAVDFRPSSLAGSRYALSLAQENEARIELVTVLERMREGSVSELIQVVRPDEDDIRQMLMRKLRERVPDDARPLRGRQIRSDTRQSAVGSCKR
jgi:nucleotide-binding universal stress UspA family protein